MPKKPDKERRFGSFWVCLNCEGNPEFEHKEMMDHLKEKHAVKEMKGKKSTVMHLDGDTWFTWQYEWEIEGLKYHQTTTTKRSGEDAAMWGGH